MSFVNINGEPIDIRAQMEAGARPRDGVILFVGPDQTAQAVRRPEKVGSA